MSVIVKNLQTNKVLNFIKGADVAIEPRIIESTKSSEDYTNNLQNMENMAKAGLRVLMFGMKELDSDLDHDKA